MQGFFTNLQSIGDYGAGGELLNETYFDTMFDQIQSDWRLAEFLAKHPNYIKPMPVKLSEDFSMEYVSLSDTLRVLLSNEDVMGEILHYTREPPNPTILSDFKDGTTFEFPILGDRCDLRIQLIFYTDEFEECNPISGARTKH